MGFDQFALNGLNNPMFAPNSGLPLSPLSPQQLQYQQALLSASARPTTTGVMYPGMSPVVGPFAGPSPSMDSFRGNPAGPGSTMSPRNGAPMNMAPMFPPAGFAGPGYNPLAGPMMAGGFPLAAMTNMSFVSHPMPPPQGHQPAQPSANQLGGGQRRGRR